MDTPLSFFNFLRGKDEHPAGNRNACVRQHPNFGGMSIFLRCPTEKEERVRSLLFAMDGTLCVKMVVTALSENRFCLERKVVMGISLAIISLCFVILIFLGYAAAAVAAGIYVYRDAKKRGMEAVLWTVLAVMIPGFLGVIAYLLVRDRQKAFCMGTVVCPQCGRQIQTDFSVCPYCGLMLRKESR